MFGTITKKLSLILTLTMVFTLCAVFCGCFEQTFVLPSVEGAESIMISSGACRMKVNDSVEKFVRIFEGLKLVEVKKTDIFGKENEKYNAALAELEDAHCVVATFSEEYELKFYFTDDGKVYYFDDETLFASKTTVDSAAVLATAKVGEGREIWDIMNTDEILNVIAQNMLWSHIPFYSGRDEVDEVLYSVFDGVLFTDNESDVLAFEDAIRDDGAFSDITSIRGFQMLLYGEFEDENIIGGSESLIATVLVSKDGRAILQIGDKIYVTADNIFIRETLIF